MVSGPVDPVWIEETARKEGYYQIEFERAYRLAHLLGKVTDRLWLSGRGSLKGGTAINVASDVQIRPLARPVR